MSFVSSVLKMKPATWDSTTPPYGKNYSLVALEDSSTEYENVRRVLVTKDYKSTEIEKIERVQHPYAYGRFLLRKEQCELRNYGCNNLV